MRVVTWNTDNAAPTSRRGRVAAAWLARLAADVICLTEAFAGVLPEGGETIEAEGDWGYPVTDERRRVLLWSAHGWADPLTRGRGELPGGRFVAATTNGVRIVGVCIPWRDAHVRTGRRDRQRWQDHLTYLTHLPVHLDPAAPTIVLGDFNQRVPRRRQPIEVADALGVALNGFDIVSQGPVPGLDEAVIDHVALSRHLEAVRVQGWSVIGADGRPVSDHTGVTVDVSGR